MISFFRLSALPLLLVSPVISVNAQAPLQVYADSLVNRFQDWGWATHDYANSAPIHTGARSVSVTINSAWAGLQIVHPDMDSAGYSSLSFWLHGGTSGGQQLQVYGLLHVGDSQNSAAPQRYSLSPLPANAWQQFKIPLSSLGVAGKTNFTGFVIQDRRGTTQPTFYVDDIQLLAAPAPAITHLDIDFNRQLRSVDARWFGVNAAVWDGNFDTATTVVLLKEMDTRILRFPGGSLSDEYHWASNKSGNNTWPWPTSFAKFAHVATNIGAEAFITVNYGSGSAVEAAGWVRHANITNRLGFLYWEIGNECFGTWETDNNANPHDAYTYALRAKDYFQQMKAADAHIKVGVVAATGEDSYVNGYTNHPALNPRTGQTHYGWTPVMLTTLKNLGVAPDFVIYHRYPEWTSGSSPIGSDDDAYLLHFSGAWAADAADLRQQVLDYLGSSSTNVELVCTENNSDAGAQGKQSTSLVNGLYYADSLGQLMQTEFNAFVWWDLRNGTDTNGCFDDVLYGWRSYGDLGMINGLNTRHPTFYAAKLVRNFAQPGDTIVGARSDYRQLAAYAARAANGALSLLVLNKDPATNLSAQVSLNGFTPGPTGTVRSYGIPQDEAARTNAPAEAQDIAGSVFVPTGSDFNFVFPALSLTLLMLAPAAPSLTVLAGPNAPDRQVVMKLEGQPGACYALESSTDFTNWNIVSTNTLATSSRLITNTVSANPGVSFWRAAWKW